MRKNGEERGKKDKHKQIIGAQQSSGVFQNTDAVLKSQLHQSPIKLLQSIIDRTLSYLPSHFLQGCCYLQGGHFAPVTHYSLANPALPSAMNL